MAEISLREYQDRLRNLAADKRFDEVIAHARHILKSQPKNLRAYELLGGALFAQGHWAEAANVLRRILGAKPQDFETHLRLAQSYQQLEQYDRAIWHAERALDQMPNDAAAIELIRELYRQHRQEEIERLQMTAGALAQRHIRGNLLAQALDTLDKALAKNPARLDLQLLRARVLWLDGQRMDAAESAVEILERLPYALDANRIMTELWLAEQRPSDAQPYLKRIEELDPYLARQLAAGEPAPADLLQLEELHYSGTSSPEQAIVDRQWLSERGGEDSGLSAIFGLGAAATRDEPVTADLDDLLSDDDIESLFSELLTGEAVAQVSEAKMTLEDELDDELEDEDEAAPVVEALDELGLLPDPPPAAQAADDEADELEDIMAQMSEPEPEAAADVALDDELASLLQQLDEASEDGDEGEVGDWMAEIQQGSLELDAEDEPLEYLEDFDREWVQRPDDEEAGGAPWLSAAMRESLDKDAAGDFDLFGDDEQLQSLLNRASDTEPIHREDIEDWLNAEPGAESEAAADAPLDIEAIELEDELLHSPPARSWLEDVDADAPDNLTNDADPNRENAALIDSWQSELGDDEDDDPYVDWLKDDPNELDEDLSIFAADADETEEAASLLSSEAGDAQEQARAWGLSDADQLADFVEQDTESAGAPDWLNAVVPGLDRENDAATDDVDEYARPMAPPGKEFAWVNDIVEEETGKMQAIDPAEVDETLYFRFSKPPAWLLNMQAEAASAADGITALSIDADIDSLELDDLTFDDYFSFDTPTDKLDVINLDEDTQELSFVGLDWDDYFDIESPTEKTIAISLDDSALDLDYDELGVEDDDFTFAGDQPAAEKSSDSLLEAEGDLFGDIGLDDEPPATDSPLWLEYKDAADDSDDPDRRSGQSTL